jgi:hypothetical protein
MNVEVAGTALKFVMICKITMRRAAYVINFTVTTVRTQNLILYSHHRGQSLVHNVTCSGSVMNNNGFWIG